ncbi:MAG TPA: hypothetical protein VKP30_32600, partial [Polyangiaceae bacterium]|nr:hypothetical protein [Polyangiaceae bacterium]
VYVALDDPFVDVHVRLDSLGPDSYELSDDELALVGQRSGDRVELGQRIDVVIEEASIQRRMTIAKRLQQKPTGSKSTPRSGAERARPRKQTKAEPASRHGTTERRRPNKPARATPSKQSRSTPEKSPRRTGKGRR